MYLIQRCLTRCSSSMYVLMRLLELWTAVVSVMFDRILFNTETANKLLTIVNLLIPLQLITIHNNHML